MLITPSIKEHQLDTNQLRHQLGTNHEPPTLKSYVEEEEETKKREEMKGKKKDISEGEEDHGSTVNANLEKELIKEEMLKKRTSPPFP